jgi:hypothetical protein
MDKSIGDYETRKLHKEFMDCFFIGADILVIVLGLIVSDIHWIIMGMQIVIYGLIQSVHVYFVYPYLFVDYVTTVVIISVSIFIIEHSNIKVAKI